MKRLDYKILRFSCLLLVCMFFVACGKDNDDSNNPGDGNDNEVSKEVSEEITKLEQQAYTVIDQKSSLTDEQKDDLKASIKHIKNTYSNDEAKVKKYISSLIDILSS